MGRSIFILSFLLVLTPILGLATTSAEFTLTEIGDQTFYAQEFDKLVLDVVIPSGLVGAEDVLKTVTVKNRGSARNFYDIDKVVFWTDAGVEGFQGMGIDDKLGEAVYYDADDYWYLTNLSQMVPAAGLRIFVSVETARNAASSRTIQLSIPEFLDYNGSGSFDLRDTGVFMASGNNGPSDSLVVNSATQYFRALNVDSLPPVVVITAPASEAELTESSYVVRGEARDQGGSTLELVEISLALEGEEVASWSAVTATSDNYRTWQYEWNDIADDTYNIKAKAKDWSGNSALSGSLIITKSTPVAIIAEPQAEEEAETIDEEAESVPLYGLQFGALIKASGAAVYYYSSNSRRYVFPNEKIYKSWYDDFSGVKTITDEELASINIGGNVYYKPGSLIKITSSPKVYYVTGKGVLRPVSSEEQAASHFGENWAKQIDDISDSLFVYYSKGDDLDDTLPTVVEEYTIGEDVTMAVPAG